MTGDPLVRTSPYLLCDAKEGRCIVRDPARDTELMSDDELLYFLEQLATPRRASRIAAWFGVDTSVVSRLLELGVLTEVASARPAPARGSAARVGIVTTLRAPGPLLESFLRYHLALGFEHVFLFFDDAREAGRVGDLDAVTAVPADAALRRRYEKCRLYPRLARHVRSEVMARQLLNVELALAMAAERGLEWLLHIDIDEAFFTRHSVGEFFARMPDRVGSVTFLNYEAAPQRLRYTDPMREVTLFKRNPLVLGAHRRAALASRPGKPAFLGYTNGKSVVRVSPEALPSGVHGFEPQATRPVWLRPALEPAILHYVYCDLEAYRRKYEIWGEFGDFQWGDPRVPWTEFHRLSRDVCRTGEPERIEAFYREHVVFDDPAEVETCLARGLCVRIVEPARVLAREAATPTGAGVSG